MDQLKATSCSKEVGKGTFELDFHYVKKVLFSDESKFQLFGSDGLLYVRRPEGKRYNPKYVLPTIKHGGGSLIVWHAFSVKERSPIFRIDGIFDSFKYINILNNVMKPYANKKMPKN